MDIVRTSMKFGFANRRREGSAGAEESLPAPSADLRTAMIFLIANMGDKISANALKMLSEIFSNRQFSRIPRIATPIRHPENGTALPRECAKMVRSIKGELVPA